MDFPIDIDTISMVLPIVYFKGVTGRFFFGGGGGGVFSINFVCPCRLFFLLRKR